LDREKFDAFARAFRDWAWSKEAKDGIEEADLRRYARRAGLHYLGAGASRFVVAVPEGVLKVAFDIVGRANRMEAHAWSQAPASIRALLVPVRAVAADASWLLMERATPGGHLSPAALQALTDCGIFDISRSNTTTDGRLLDYDARLNEKWVRCAGAR